MVRTFGSKDLSPRKVRSDKGKKRKTYRGKPVKTQRQKRYDRRRGNKTHIKIWIVEERPMSPSGVKRWNKYVRRYAHKTIYKPLNVHLVKTEDINTQEKVEMLVEENYWEGVFLVRGFSHGKNKMRVKPVKLCRIRVKSTPMGLRGRMVDNYRLNRYKWFYKG